jgi:hypothetical protein
MVRVAAVRAPVKVRLWGRLDPFLNVRLIGPVARTEMSVGRKASVSPGEVVMVTLVSGGVEPSAAQPARTGPRSRRVTSRLRPSAS